MERQMQAGVLVNDLFYGFLERHLCSLLHR
jgi:hypothetical protein